MSNVTQCPDCGGAVSIRAAACPHCGAPLASTPGQPPPPPSAQQPVAPSAAKASGAWKRRVAIGAGVVVFLGLAAAGFLHFFPIRSLEEKRKLCENGTIEEKRDTCRDLCKKGEPDTCAKLAEALEPRSEKSESYTANLRAEIRQAHSDACDQGDKSGCIAAAFGWDDAGDKTKYKMFVLRGCPELESTEMATETQWFVWCNAFRTHVNAEFLFNNNRSPGVDRVMNGMKAL